MTEVPWWTDISNITLEDCQSFVRQFEPRHHEIDGNGGGGMSRASVESLVDIVIV